MTLILTSAHEAALNAVAEVVADLGVKRFTVSFYRDGPLGGGGGRCYIHGDVETATGEVSPTGSGDGIVEAARDFIEKANRAIDNPQERPLRKPSEVKSAVAKIVDELRESGDLKGGEGRALDDIADRIAALPVKE